MTLNEKPSKDTFQYRKGGYCKYCKVKVTSMWSHVKTKKHKLNNPNYEYELKNKADKLIENIKKENAKILKQKIKEIEEKNKTKKEKKEKPMRCVVKSSVDEPIFLFGDD